MTTTVTLTVGSYGRQYSTLPLAWAAIPADLVAADVCYILDLYADSEFIYSDTVTLSGKNTDAAHWIKVRAATGQAYYDYPDSTGELRYSILNGVAIKISKSYSNALVVSNDYTTLSGLQIKSMGDGGGATLVLGAANTLADMCVIDINKASNLAYGASVGNGNVLRNSVIILSNISSIGVSFGGNTTPRVENVTIVRANDKAVGGTGFDGSINGPTIVNSVVSGCSSFASRSDFTGFNNAFSSTIPFGTGNVENVDMTTAFNWIGSTSYVDVRLKSGSPLIDKGKTPSAGNVQTMSGNRQMGTSADIGAYEYPQAIMAPSAAIGSINVAGTSVTISGDYTGVVDSGTASITATNVPGNNAVPQGPIAVTFDPNASTFTVTFNNCKIGRYDVAISVTNSAYTVAAQNNVGGFEISGPKALTVVQDPIDGQNYSLHGTCSGATTGHVIIPAAATSPNGAVQQTLALTLNTGVTPNTYSASTQLAPGNYDAGVLTFSSADGTSLPQSGTAAVSIIPISGNPNAPAQDPPDSVAPTMTGSLTISNVTATSMTATWNAGSDNIGVVAYQFSQDDGVTWANVGNVLTTTINGLAANTLYKLRVCALDPANNKSNSLTAQATTATAAGTGARTVTLALFTPADAPAAALSGLRWAWFDQVTPDLFGTPTDKGAVEATDSGGMITIALPNSQLAAGATGWLVVTNSDGNPATAHNAFSGPVAVA